MSRQIAVAPALLSRFYCSGYRAKAQRRKRVRFPKVIIPTRVRVPDSAPKRRHKRQMTAPPVPGTFRKEIMVNVAKDAGMVVHMAIWAVSTSTIIMAFLVGYVYWLGYLNNCAKSFFSECID